jgi:cupin 2 domain-containing protein
MTAEVSPEGAGSGQVGHEAGFGGVVGRQLEVGGRVERIVSRGHRSPMGFWYEQDEHEFVLPVAGQARIEIDNQPERTLHPGQWLHLPAHLRHRVSFTDPDRDDTIWLALFHRP